MRLERDVNQTRPSRETIDVAGDRLLFRRCGLRGLAENAAASFAEVRPLPAHAGGNALDIRDFRRAKPHHVTRAKPSLIFLGKCLARGGPQGRAERHASDELESPDAEQVGSHGRPHIGRRCGRSPGRFLRPGINAAMVAVISPGSTRRDGRALFFKVVLSHLFPWRNRCVRQCFRIESSDTAHRTSRAEVAREIEGKKRGFKIA